jgi:transposase-like protein
MAKRAPKRSDRTVRREQERAQTRLESDRERLFALSPGGSPERPLGAASAAVIEGHALSVPCPRCGANHELLEHSAHVRQGVRLRETQLRCRQCGSQRSLWFKIVGPSLN